MRGSNGEPLRDEQHWLQGAILAPDRPDSAAKLAPSATLSADERLDIYRDMYRLRLEGALEIDYPVLRSYLGPERFRAIALEYVERHPSRSYTLNRLGDRLPLHLAETAENDDGLFLAELAAFELAMTQVFDEAASPVLTEAEIAAVPAPAWERARIETIPALRLRAHEFDIAAAHEAWRRKQPVQPRRRATWLAVYRRDCQVFRLDLEPAAFDLLSDLSEGCPFGDAVERTCLAHGGEVEERLFAWFRDWTAERLFARVVLD